MTRKASKFEERSRRCGGANGVAKLHEETHDKEAYTS